MSYTVTLNFPLYQQWQRLKMEGKYQSDQELMQACLSALERKNYQDRSMAPTMSSRYMTRPGLSPDDYDT